MQNFISRMPKAELHLHIEGTFEPELIFEIGKRNKVAMRYASIEALREAYAFNNLQEFLDIYYEGANVLLKEVDFYDLTYAYLKKCNEQNIRHTEIMFDPQTHTERGVKFETVIEGIWGALEDAKRDFDITSVLIMSFLRHLSAESAMNTLKEGLKFKDRITSVGLDSSELGHPPSKFRDVFKAAADAGFLLQAHAGEEGPPEYVWEALDILNIARIDHGNRSLEDDALVAKLVERKMHLTVCPLSNLRLCVVKNLLDHPLKKMMDKGLFVSVNSDDPPYFGGYLNENFIAVQENLNLSKQDIYQLARNSFEGAFLDDGMRKKYLDELDIYFREPLKTPDSSLN